VAVAGDPQPGDPRGLGPDHAYAPQEPEDAGPDGARPAAEHAIDAEPDHGITHAEHPGTASEAAYQWPSENETAPAFPIGPPTQGRPRAGILVAVGIVALVAAIAVTFVLIKLNTKTAPPPTSSGSNAQAGAASAAIIGQVTSVPSSALNAAGDGGGLVTERPIALHGAPLASNGKPEMFYFGSEFCPFCAAERWAMIVALGRFGTFSGLAIIRSAAADGAGDPEPYPDTATWTFAKASYSSPYLAFAPVENLSNIPDPATGGYTTLETPTAAQRALVGKFDGPPYVPSADAGAIPFIDFGNRYGIFGASYSPQVLAGLSWSQIAGDLSNPDSAVGEAIGGTANYLTAAICAMTGNQPASACTSIVRSLETQLGS
jgi:hypothetical protein